MASKKLILHAAIIAVMASAQVNAALTTAVATYATQAVTAADGSIVFPNAVTWTADAAVPPYTLVSIFLPAGMVFGQVPVWTSVPAGAFFLVSGGPGEYFATFVNGSGIEFPVGGTLTVNPFSVDGATALESPTTAALQIAWTTVILNR